MKTLLKLIQAAPALRPISLAEMDSYPSCTIQALLTEIEACEATTAFCNEFKLPITEIGLSLIFDQGRINVIHPESGEEKIFSLDEI